MDLDAFMRDLSQLGDKELAAKYCVSERFVKVIRETDAVKYNSLRPAAADAEFNG